MSRSPYVQTLLEYGLDFDISPNNFRLEALVYYVASFCCMCICVLLFFYRDGCLSKELTAEEASIIEEMESTNEQA